MGSNPTRCATSEQSPLCSDVLLFLRNKRTSSARSLAPPFQITTAALGRDLVLGAALEAETYFSRIGTARRALFLLLLASKPDSLRWIPVRVGKRNCPE